MAQEFTAFFASTCPGMVAKAIVLSGHRQEAEDAVQEAYTEALRSWDRIGDYDSPEAWVYKVMRQRLWASSRKASRQVPSGVDLKVPAGSMTDPERAAEARAAIAALAGLPGKLRFIVVMHCLNGMPLGDVARELGLARGTVGFYLHSARRLLEQTLGLAPDKLTDQPLVRAGSGVAAVDPADRLVRRLRAAEGWLRIGLAGDDVTVAGLGTAVTAGARVAGDRRWARWRRGRALEAVVTGADEGGSQ